MRASHSDAAAGELASEALALQRFVGQFVCTDAEDIFHHHGDRLHQFAAACRARLRESAGRRNRALSPAER